MGNWQDQRHVLWIVNRDDKIVLVNQDWLAFARENATPHLVEEAVINRDLWHFIADKETTYLYKMVLERVRTQKPHLIIPFRCDSPDCRRFMEMTISHLPEDAVKFQSRILKQELREAVRLLDISVSRSSHFLPICSWCKKIEVSPERWLEVEDAIKTLDLFVNENLPQLSHGICNSCFEQVSKSLR